MNVQQLSPPRNDWRIWITRTGWLLVVGLVVSLFFANAPYMTRDTINEWQFREAWPFARQLFASRSMFAIWLVFWRGVVGLIFMGTAGLLAWRKWSSGIVLLISADLLLLGIFYTLSFNIDLVRFPRLLTRLIPNLNGITMLLIVGAMLSLFYLFPDGQSLPLRWRWVAGLAVANALLWSVIFGFPSIARWLESRFPNLQSDGDIGWTLFIGSLLVALAVGLAGQVYRYRWVASAEQRLQTKWGLLGLLGILAVPLGTFFLYALFNMQQTPLSFFINLHVQSLTIVLLPLTIAFSVLRYRLWEVDIWLNRTLVYGTLSALVIVTYGVLVGGLGVLLSGESVGLAVLTTVIIALLIQPLRESLQRMVNRLLYGEQEEPMQMLSQLGAQLESSADINTLIPTLVETVAMRCKLPYVAVRLSDDALLASYGTPNGKLETWPLHYQDRAVGQLEVAPRSPTEALTMRDRRLLATIAHQAGAAVHSLKLSNDLRWSRQRIIVAREEERRRIRRDLHDGLGPQLATLMLKIDTARNVLRSGGVESAQFQLVELKQEVQNALTDVRQLVYNLRPPALDQLGLVEALHQLVNKLAPSTLAVSIDAPDPLPPLPAAVEVALYRIVSEAITNVVHHAQAQQCAISLHIADAIVVTVVDDGVGIETAIQQGVGLSSMRERSAELGGNCDITRQLQGGTMVRATLPRLTG